VAVNSHVPDRIVFSQEVVNLAIRLHCDFGSGSGGNSLDSLTNLWGILRFNNRAAHGASFEHAFKVDVRLAAKHRSKRLQVLGEARHRESIRRKCVDNEDYMFALHVSSIFDYAAGPHESRYFSRFSPACDIAKSTRSESDTFRELYLKSNSER
jgi:hypothetical protein